MSEKTDTQIIRIYGVVQGVGFRPFVSRLAGRLGIAGHVANKGSYVEIHAQGSERVLKEFRLALEREAPERSSILKIDVRREREALAEGFDIVESAASAGDIFVSPDIAVCEHCRRELFDPRNRRYLHAFINCTACGPRLTILDAMPYDRERTSMKEFPMCDACRWEYTHAETRRYDAQPVCCPECGPEVYVLDAEPALRGVAAITEARRAMMDGKIVAIKGIGGFHLACDARCESAVARLRRLKHRPMKPFAVMMRDLTVVRRECEVSEDVEKILDGHQKPIILLKRKTGGSLPEILAPGNPALGVMLPYAPVQLLLFDAPDGVRMTDVLVMTSGNVSGAPICRNEEDARREIGGFCDMMLSNNRRIRLRADDSVMDFFESKPYMIRRSRGYAPLPFMLSGDWRGTVLGIGGELKNTFCIGKDTLFYPSPYLGDMEDIRTVGALRESVARLGSLLEARPEIVACDLHPGYHTTEVAETLQLPVLKIQHHYAHILSCMAENDYAGEVLGVAFDGTGYGTDGTIWGGELLRASYAGFERLGHIRQFVQTGGDASAREGWRIAAAMLHAWDRECAGRIARELDLCSEKEFKVQAVMADRRLNSVFSTSAGRLFDAVSAILGFRRESTFEGEASMALEFAAAAWRDAHGPVAAGMPEWAPPPVAAENQLLVLDTDALFHSLAAARLQGGCPERLAYEFHIGLARRIAAGCVALRERTKLTVCALSGGVFQNKLLLELCVKILRENNFRVLLHSLVPPNDGGIALGQAAAAMSYLQNNRSIVKK